MKGSKTVYVLQIFLVFVLLSVFSGCGGVDTSKDFAMKYNDGRYGVTLTPAEATLKFADPDDPEYSEVSRCRIEFPVKPPNYKGGKVYADFGSFALYFGPQNVKLGEVMDSAEIGEDEELTMAFFPPRVFQNKENVVYFSSAAGTGFVKVRIDALEPKLLGKVQGKILHAVMYGKSGEKSDISKKMEIFNFPFDTTFISSPRR